MNKLRIIISMVIIFIIAAGLLLWAKHDADQKASAYESSRSTLLQEYSSGVEKLLLSQQVANGKADDAVAERAICESAQSLRDKVIKAGTLPGSFGSSFSSTYKKAVSESKKMFEVSGELERYAALCNYYVLDTERRVEYTTVHTSAELAALTSSGPAACGREGTCIETRNFSQVVPIQQRKIDINQKYVNRYEETTCPLTSDRQSVCEAILAFERALLEDARDYKTGLTSGNRELLNRASRLEKSRAAFDALNQTVRAVDAKYSDVNMLWKDILSKQEQKLQSMLV